MRRARLSLRAAATLLLVACSSSPSRSSSSPSNAGGDETTTSIVIGANGSSSVIVAPRNDSSSATGGDTASSSGTSSSATALDASGPPGSFASAYLVAATSTEIDVDVRSQSSSGPLTQESIDHVRSVLDQVSGKTVVARQGAPIAGGARDWSADDLRAIADEPHTVQQGNGRTVIHLLFVHGTLGGDDSVLGAAVRGDTAAIFVDRVRASETPLVGSNGIEVAVVTHEVGHLLGLVDLYLHTGRQDPDHPGHSTDKSSVMYWAVESDLVADLLGSGPPRDFDRADLADLQSIRDGG